MCVYRDPMFDLILDVKAAWTSALLPSADELAHRCSVASEQPRAHWDFYMSLAYFKGAGIDFRSRMAGSDHTEVRVGETVAPMIAAGLTRLRT